MPVLIDFDVAHAKDQHTVTRTADGLFVWVGNEDYAAPERFLDFTYSEAPMDIFSLGVVLYEMLTYQRPYPSYSRHSVLHYGDSLSSPLREDIPDPLYRLLRAMLQFEPQERPDAGAVIACLQDCLRQLTVARTLPEEQISAEERNFWLTRVYVRIGKILERIMHHEKP
jgi:serine/threonine-protein kinase